MTHRDPPPLVFPVAALRLNERICGELRRIIEMDLPDCGGGDFMKAYRTVLVLYDTFQRKVLKASGISLPCASGCSICCCHWADDVYSFEAGIIAGLVRTMPAPESERIFSRCMSSMEEYARIRTAATERIDAGDFDGLCDVIDIDEITLKSFYLLESRCPFQDADGRCIVYAWRPLTCRCYINLGDPALCPPSMIDVEDVMTMILDLDDEANSLLDELHARYERFPGDRGLRSQVLKLLGGEGSVKKTAP